MINITIKNYLKENKNKTSKQKPNVNSSDYTLLILRIYEALTVD